MPDSILVYVICEFLDRVEVMFLSQSSKDLRVRIVRHRSYALNETFSWKFLTDTDFRNYIQLRGCIFSLDLSYRSELFDLSVLKECNIHTIYLTHSSVVDVSPLCNINTLHLDYCYNLIDVSPLKNACELKLDGSCQIHDVSSLENVNKLSLKFLPISDVSKLGNVQSLSLACCENITDISALGKVNKLDLRNCKNITKYF